MKARIAGFSLALLAALSFAAGAQTHRGISPGAIPIEQEPQHKIAFKDDFVRIIDATLPPGDDRGISGAGSFCVGSGQGIADAQSAGRRADGGC